MRPEERNDSSILIIEDSEESVLLFEHVLAGAGYRRVFSVRDSKTALDTFLAVQPDLILLDLHMPDLDGYEVMEALKPHIPESTFLPIVVITADSEPAARIRCLQAGAKDFIAKPCQPDELLLRMANLLETRHLRRFLEQRNETLELKVMAEQSEVKETQLEILRRLAVAAEYRDDVTGRHSERVGITAALLGDRLGLLASEVESLEKAAPLHDVGKMGIPDSILLKPGKLTAQEFETMKTHTTIGGVILSRDSIPLLGYAREIALSHHEWWDGSGYPNGLSGEQIPLSGRIVAVADVFDSIVHARSYKRAFAVEEALDIMIDQRGRHFSSDLLDLFVHLVRSGQVHEALSGITALETAPVCRD